VLFVSYSREDRPAVEQLATDLTQFGREVWLDERLEGGVEWWDEIVQRIRDCEAFLFVVSSTSSASRPCRAELAYALELDRPVIPVSIRPDVDDLLPGELVDRQVIGYIEGTKAEVADLIRALGAHGPPGPLPDPLPPSPPAPISRYARLRDEVRAEVLDADDQVGVLRRIRAWQADEGDRERALGLAEELRSRPDLLAAVAPDVDALLAELTPAAASRERRPRVERRVHSLAELIGLEVAVLAVVALALGQITDGVYSDCDGCEIYGWGPNDSSSGGVGRWVYVGAIALLVLSVVAAWVFGAARTAAVVVTVTGLIVLLRLWADVAHLTSGGTGVNQFGASVPWTFAGGALAGAAGVLLLSSAFGSVLGRTATRSAP
jgi:TIR domain